MRLRSSHQTAQPRRAVTLTEILVVISILVALTGFGFYAFVSAREFAGKRHSETGAAIARVSANAQMRRIPPAKTNDPIVRLPRPAYVPQGGAWGYQRIGTSPIAPHTPYNPIATGVGVLEGCFGVALIPEAVEPYHFTSVLIDGPEVASPIGAPVLPPVWKTNYSTSVDTFWLHSRPGANIAIFLDFDGHYVDAKNQWAMDFNAGATVPIDPITGLPAVDPITGLPLPAVPGPAAPITSLPWSMDKDRTTFSTVERTKIIQMWARVAEDFAPFDVDVTTEEPTAADMVYSGPGDTKWGIRVIIGPRPPSPGPNDWSTVGGIAYTGSFRNGVDICCWVWNGDLDANPENSIPTSVSHQVGHTMGLSNDSTATLKDYPGHGSGNASWGPIMGGAFGRNVDQWSMDSYPGANNAEDDLAIITGGISGITFIADDHANTSSSATALNAVFQGTLLTTYGIIESKLDTDVFVFQADPGAINIRVDPFLYGPNLDVKAEIYDSTGALLWTGTRPADQLYAEFKRNIPTAGTYYLAVSGNGRADPNGYTNYGSLGNYRITGTVQPLLPVVAASGAPKGFKMLNPTRWTYDPASQSYSGYLTLSNLDAMSVTGKFRIDITLPDSSVQVLSPGGTQTGSSFSWTFKGTLEPGQPMNFQLKLTNPNRRVLPTGFNSFPFSVQQIS